MSDMLVTVITVAYNSEATIARTVESVLMQTYSNVEYIVIDGKSSDRTVEEVERFREAFDKTEGRYLTVISEPDKGMYDALNKGARMAHGEIVGQINSDDWYEPDAVTAMAEMYLKDDYDAAWGSIRIIKPGANMIKHARIGKIWTTSGWCHPAMFTRREVLLNHPYPLESMYDDFDFITRLHVGGYRIMTIDKIISNFTFGGMSTQKSVREAIKRVNITYGIYRKYNMSRLYLLHRVILEGAKVIWG